MDKENNSILILGKNEKSISSVMILPMSLIGMLTHVHMTKGFVHFSYYFLKMDSNFNVTLLSNFLEDLEEPMVD